MDFKVKYADKNGKIGVMLIEVKPSSKIQKPKPAKKSKRYIEEVFEWGVNEAKWKAASEYCKDRGWQFKIMTEKELR